jgi:hypothetical protein
MWVLTEQFSFKTIAPEVKAINEGLIAALMRTPLECNVWLYGAPGAGKSHLAKCALNRHLYRCLLADYVTGPDFNEMTREFPRDRKERENGLVEAQLLLVDDIDKVVMTADTMATMWSVFDRRYRAGKRTIVTSNMTAGAVSDAWKCIRNLNETTLSAMLDRMNPIKQYQVHMPEAVKSLRKTHAPAPSVGINALVGKVVSVGASMQVQNALRGGNLAALASMEGE